MRACVCAQIAVLREMDGKGSFCSLVMAVVVVKDVVVIVAYALNMEAIRAVRHTHTHTHTHTHAR